MFGPRWSPDGHYISALTADQKKMMLFSVDTGKWSELITGQNLQYPNWSHDGKSIYFERTENNGPELFSVDIVTHRADRIVGLKDIPRVSLAYGNQWSGLTPDGSPLIMRDVGNREIYALELQLP